jgi:hypothetical protein
MDLRPSSSSRVAETMAGRTDRTAVGKARSHRLRAAAQRVVVAVRLRPATSHPWRHPSPAAWAVNGRLKVPPTVRRVLVRVATHPIMKGVLMTRRGRKRRLELEAAYRCGPVGEVRPSSRQMTTIAVNPERGLTEVRRARRRWAGESGPITELPDRHRPSWSIASRPQPGTNTWFIERPCAACPLDRRRLY